MKVFRFVLFIFVWILSDVSIYLTQYSNKIEENYSAELLQKEVKICSLSSNLQENETNYRNTLNDIVIALYEKEKFQTGGIEVKDIYTKDIDSLIEAIKNQTTDFNKYLKNIDNFFDERALINKRIPSIFPVAYHDNVRITDPYGMRIYPLNKNLIFHEGVDISGDLGTEIIATAKGKISQVWIYHPIFGIMLEIDHGNGYKTMYAHMSWIYVEYQQEVEQGEVIGVMGATGKSTGRHLHYEITYNNKSVNPFDYLNSIQIKY